VGDILIEGNHAVPSGEIVDKLAMTKSGFRFIFRFGDANPFDAQFLQIERLRIQRIYQSYGYYSARVVDVRTALDHGRINVTFVVDEGLPTKVTQLIIDGLGALPPDVRDSVLKKLPLAAGDVFSESAYEGLKDALKSRLRDAGYWEASSEGHVTVDPGPRTSAVETSVVAGARYTIGSLRVSGTNDVSFVRVEDASTLRPGQRLAPSLLATARRKVQAMGVFAQVTIKPESLDREKGTAAIVIEVEDAPFQSVDSGVGVEVDPTRQLARVRAVYTHRNLGTNLEKIIAGGSIGYAFLPNIFAPTENGIIADLQFLFVQPKIFRWPMDANAGVTYTKDLTPAFGYQRAGAQVGTLVYINPIEHLTFAPSVHYDYYFDVSTGTPQPTIPGIPSTSFATSGCGPLPSGQTTPRCSIFYVEGRLVYDLRDDPLDPRRGAYLSVAVQYASPVISDFNYFRINPQARFYAPLGPRLTLATRIDYGLLQQLGNGRPPPGVSRFFAGGETSVRATSADQLGPREFVVLPNTGSGAPFIAGTPVPVGGDHLLDGSVELRWHTPWYGFGLSAFFDIGRLQLLQGNPVPSTDGGYQYGPGLGISYHTPFGPLRVDLAYRVSTLDANPVSVDTTNVKNPTSSGVPTTLFSSSGEPNYRFSSDCAPLAGQHAYQCYSDSRFEFFVTLGESF
jgi:translocation and assembly module TamA